MVYEIIYVEVLTGSEFMVNRSSENNIIDIYMFAKDFDSINLKSWHSANLKNLVNFVRDWKPHSNPVFNHCHTSNFNKAFSLIKKNCIKQTMIN